MERSEDDKLFSSERAKRGAKIGAIASSSLLIGSSIIAAEVAEFRDPGTLLSLVEAVNEDPKSFASAYALYIGYHTAVGALVDSFKPTSRFISNQVRQEIEKFKTIREDFRKAKESLKDHGFSTVRDNLADIRYLPKELLASMYLNASVYGGLSGATLWGVLKVSDILDKTSGFNSPVLSTIADHPLETIAGGIITGAGVATGILAFRPDRN
jgi:hypothetical protein